MDHSYRTQRIDAHNGRTDGPSGPSRSEQHSWFPLVSSAKTYGQSSRTSSLRSYYTPPYSFTPPNTSSPQNTPSSSTSSPSSAPTPPSAPILRQAGPSNASPYSYYSANTSPLSNLSTNSSSTQSSNVSFPYSVTSINSYKSRKNVLYPRRVHPPAPPPVVVVSEPSVPPDVRHISSYSLPRRKKVWSSRRVHPPTPPPVTVMSEPSISPDVRLISTPFTPLAEYRYTCSYSTQALIWQVRFLCTTLLPYAETRLLPAGNVLLQSLGQPMEPQFSPHVPLRFDEETLFCSQLFIALTHEVLLKDAVSAGKLENPCKLLHT